MIALHQPALESIVKVPNKNATRSNEKIPTNPQFKAPININANTIFCNPFILDLLFYKLYKEFTLINIINNILLYKLYNKCNFHCNYF